jgi:hypothetical protein
VTKFVELEIYPIREDGDQAFLADSDADADYFGLFGRISGEQNDFYVCIGDYKRRHDAELTKVLLDKNKTGLPL